MFKKRQTSCNVCIHISVFNSLTQTLRLIRTLVFLYHHHQNHHHHLPWGWSSRLKVPNGAPFPWSYWRTGGEALGWATRNRRFCGRWSCWKSWGNSRKIRMVRILMTISAFLGTTKSWTSGFGCLGSVRAVLGRTGEVERGTRCAWRQGWESGGSKDGVGRWTEWCIGSSPWVSWQVMGNGLASLAQLGKWKLWTLEPTIFEIRRLKVTYSDRFTNESET